MISHRFFVLVLMAASLACAPARAQLETLHSKLWAKDRSNPDFVEPALNDGKTYPAMQDDWTPEDWTKARGSKEAVLDGFYGNGLIVGQDLEDKTPVIEVGDNFMKLSNRDMNRVAAYLDAAYGYSKATGMFYMHYPPSKKPFGVYTKSGLTLQ